MLLHTCIAEGIWEGGRNVKKGGNLGREQKWGEFAWGKRVLEIGLKRVMEIISGIEKNIKNRV